MDCRSLCRRALLAALLGAAWPALAQEAKRSFAVLSEVAHDIRVVVSRPETGTRLGNNLEERLPIKDGALDKVALVAARSALQGAAPGAPVWLISPLDTDLFESRQNYTEGSIVPIPDDLAQGIKAKGSTHLLLFTRFKAEAALHAFSADLGTGHLEGVGFFVDRQTRMSNRTTLVDSVGFIAPYIYIRATLIELPSGKVLKSRRITQSTVLAAERAEQGGDPWNVLTGGQKVRIIGDMIVAEVNAAVPALLAAP